MTAPERGSFTVGINPYSPTAVALVTELSEALITVPTPAVREAFHELDAYLRAPAPLEGRRRGGVLTVVGEYGSGKTHLAAALWWRSSAGDPPAAHSVYLDAPADTFVRLHQRFVMQLNRYDILDVMRDYYADIVADDLAGTAGTEEIAQRLRSGEVDPVDVVRRLRLMESGLMQRLQESLIQATGHPGVGTALTLLLDPTMESTAWDWLAGNRPNEYLQERGIVKQIDNEADALQAIVAFAGLYGQRRRRFVLILDELDRVLAAVSQLGTESIGEFRRALTAFEQAGAFVVLVGQSEIQRTLGVDVLQRMGHIITMPPMSISNVREYVSRSHQIARGDDSLAPFAEKTLAYLTEITDGVPRQIIRLCHFLYAEAQQQGEAVTIDMVRSVARNHFDIATVLDVRREVPQVLYREGIPFSRGHVSDDRGELIVDFWITGPDGGSRCAVLICGSLLTSSDVTDVKGRVAAARKDDAEVDVVLIAVGYLSEDAKVALDDLHLVEYFGYYRRSLREDLVAAISASRWRDDLLDGADDLPIIRERVERITRQEASLHALVERLSAQMSAYIDASERQVAALRREIADVSYRIPAGSAAASDTDQAALPAVLARTEQVFTPALQAVDDLHRIEEVLADAFGTEPEQTETVSDARQIVRSVLQQQDGLSPLGAAYFLRKLVEAFRTAITQWYWHSDVRTMGELSTSDRSRLDSLCYDYDSMFQHVRLIQLKRLAESSARFTSYVDAVPGLFGQVTHLEDISDKFENLSVRVRATVLEKISADPPS